MKGRHTSFQRFGSGSHNPFGAVLNKYFLTSDSVRRNNIYEQTFSGRIGEATTDLGEEVFGCIAKGINTQGQLEGNEQLMTTGRKLRKDVQQYVLGSEGSILRSWKDEKGISRKDSVLIPQESLPLNVISKYPIKYSYDTLNDNDQTIPIDVNIPASAGFSGPYLYRPKKFPTFTPTILKEMCIVKSNFSGRPVIPVKIPSDVAHQILNCTMEIKLTGDLDHSKKGSNKQCSGSSSATVKQTYFLAPTCRGQSWRERTWTANYSCTSTKSEVTLQVKGSISGTLSRYNILTSLWGQPVNLNLSPNYYQGSNAQKGHNFFAYEGINCECESDENLCPDARDYMKAKMLGEREKVTKLDAGCAVTPTLDVGIIRRDQEKNLLSTSFGNAYCDNSGGRIEKTLILSPEQSYVKVLLGTKNEATTGGTLPSGPSLYGSYSAGLAEYVGQGGSTKLFKSAACSANEIEYFRPPAGAALQTGLEVSMSGSCPNLAFVDLPLGISEFDGTDRDRAYAQWEVNADDDSGLEYCEPCSIYLPQGTYYLDCQKEGRCYKDSDSCYDETNSSQCPKVPHPSGSGYESKCAAPFHISFDIARYAQVGAASTIKGIKYVDAEVVPLDVQAKSTDEQDLCLSFMFSGSPGAAGAGNAELGFGYPQVLNSDFAQVELPIYAPIITPCKTWHDNMLQSSAYETKVVSVGSLTLKAGSWSSTAIPLYTTHAARLATECVGVNVASLGGPHGWITACKRVNEGICDESCGDCCGGTAGCGNSVEEEPCNERADCEPIKCAFSFSSSSNDGCPKTADCGACTTPPQGKVCCDECICCGCECDGDDLTEYGEIKDPCPPGQSAPPTTISGSGKMGCYGDGQEKETLATTCNITLEFIPFAETGGVNQKQT